MTRNNILTASRQSCLLTCPRKHYWRYEVGLQHESESLALRLGKAWAKAMEARWKGADAEAMLAAALPEGATQLDEMAVATLSGLIAGYFSHYREEVFIKTVHPEVAFADPLPGSRTFTVAGKMDGLAVLHDGRLVLKEDKTTASDLAPDSDYWLRLRWNAQLFQYVIAARAMGWDVAFVIYDVVRKPSIRPKQVKGQDRKEEPAEYYHRLYADTLERPEFYFARREVPILEDDLDSFRVQRLTLSKLILFCRAMSTKKPEDAWPRNVSELTCRNCSFAGFCLSNVSVDLNNPPAGFKVGDPNPELAAQ